MRSRVLVGRNRAIGTCPDAVLRKTLQYLGGLLLLMGVWAGSAQAVTGVTYVTGESGSSDVIFRVEFDTAVAGSGVATIAVTDARMLSLDGIDFVPGTSDTEVVIGMPPGKIGRFNVSTGTVLTDFIADTDAIDVSTPPPTPSSWPSSILATTTHFYYVENQFGLGSTPDHRIIRRAFSGGAEELVFDGSAAAAFFGGAALTNFEGLEIVNLGGGFGERLFFFTEDPFSPPDRWLVSIGLTGAGVWDGLEPFIELSGLSGAVDGTGADELDFDPFTDLLFGTNIVTGEVIAYDPAASAPVVPPGGTSPFFISPAQVASGAADGLGLLGLEIDGIRSDGAGRMVFTGRGGVVGSFDIASIVASGATDAAVHALVLDATKTFDDLTPMESPAGAPLPALGPGGLAVLAALLLWMSASVLRSRRLFG